MESTNHQAATPPPRSNASQLTGTEASFHHWYFCEHARPAATRALLALQGNRALRNGSRARGRPAFGLLDREFHLRNDPRGHSLLHLEHKAFSHLVCLVGDLDKLLLA